MMTRRSVLGILVGAATLVAGGIVGIPALLAGLSPVFWVPQKKVWQPVGQLNEFPIGAVSDSTMLTQRETWPRSFRRRAVFVWRRNEAEVVVFSRSCTDLGCPLTYDRGSACFLCPCHGGIFRQDGERLGGPPGKPMHRYVYRIRDGVLEIDLASIPPAA
jgi:menaquinol-cytochrome c reductase iron-sulfur subunit